MSIVNIEEYKSRYNFCIRDGNIVTVSCEVYDISVVATGLYFIIPDKYRPKHDVNAIGYVEYYNGSIETSIFNIATSGNVHVNHGSGNTTLIGFACTYHV